MHIKLVISYIKNGITNNGVFSIIQDGRSCPTVKIL